MDLTKKDLTMTMHGNRARTALITILLSVTLVSCQSGSGREAFSHEPDPADSGDPSDLALLLGATALGLLILSDFIGDGSTIPLTLDRIESEALPPHTLITSGYRSFVFDMRAEVVLLNDHTEEPLWTYDAAEAGGLSFAHSAYIEGDEMLITDTFHNRILVVEARNGIYSEDPDFHVVWNSDDDSNLRLDYPNDANFLPNSNLLITERVNHRVIEVDRDTGGIVWQFGITHRPGSDGAHLDGPHNADRLPGGNTIIADSMNERILEVDPRGEIVWEYWPAGRDQLNWPRDADVLDNGDVLITDSKNGRVLEVTRTGETVWEFTIDIEEAMCSPYEADRLENGNILIACPGPSSGVIFEVDYPTREVVWRYPSEG